MTKRSCLRLLELWRALWIHCLDSCFVWESQFQENHKFHPHLQIHLVICRLCSFCSRLKSLILGAHWIDRWRPSYIKTCWVDSKCASLLKYICSKAFGTISLCLHVYDLSTRLDTIGRPPNNSVPIRSASIQWASPNYFVEYYIHISLSIIEIFTTVCGHDNFNFFNDFFSSCFQRSSKFWVIMNEIPDPFELITSIFDLEIYLAAFSVHYWREYSSGYCLLQS